MSFDNIDARVVGQVEDAIEFPGTRTPRVLVDEVPLVSWLVAVQRHTELDVLRRLSVSFLELSQPFWTISMYKLVEFLQVTK